MKNKSLWGIAFPLILNMLISQLQMIIDRSFLGKLNVEFMSALGNVSAPMWTSLSVIFAITTGATVLMSQAIGEGRKERVEKLAHSVLKYNTFAALAIFMFWFLFSKPIFMAMGVVGDVLRYCLDYTYLILPMILFTGVLSASTSILQSFGFTKPVLIAGVTRSLLNVVLDWLLIFGHWGFPAMGLKGAALATSIAEFGGVLVFLLIMFSTKSLGFRITLPKIFKADFSFYKQIAKKGLPSAGEEFLWNFGNMGTIRLLNMINMAAAGIHTMIFSIEIIPALAFIAVGQAVMSIAGQHTGKRDKEGALKIGIRGIVDSWIISTVILVLFVVIPRPILKIFTSDPEVIKTSITLMFIAGIKSYPRSMNIVLGSAIRAFGDTRWMFMTQVIGTFFVLIVAALGIFVFDMGILGVFWAVFWDETLRALINAWRFKKGPNLELLDLAPEPL